MLARPIAVDDDRAFYLASPGEILARLAGVDDTVPCTILVGHNPGIETLAGLLAGPGSEQGAMADLARGFPTAGVAVFTLATDSWSETGAADSRLVAFLRPRDL